MSILNKEGVEPNVETMKATAKALGIKMPRGRAKPATIVKALREGFAKRLEGIPEDDWIRCPVCEEVTDDDDAIEACPFCGDEGEDDEGGEEATESDKAAAESEKPEPIDASELDDDDSEAEEPPVANLDEEPAGAADAAETAETTQEPATEEDDTRPPDDDGPAEEPAAAEGDGKKPYAELAEAGEEMLAALNTEKDIMRREQTNMVGAGYELGMAIRRIREGNLWKAEGHKNFRRFCESMGISHTLAYSLVELTEKYDKATFLEVGRKKLQIVARADAEDQDELLGDAKGGASATELEEKKRKKRKAREDKPGGKPGGKPAGDPAAGKPGRPSKEDQTITLLAKVGGKAMVYPFHDRKSQAELEKWEKDSYVQIQLSDDVFLLVALKTNRADEIVGIMATYRRATTKEAATDAAAE